RNNPKKTGSSTRTNFCLPKGILMLEPIRIAKSIKMVTSGEKPSFSKPMVTI
ncbi:unnamed protein product, partial [marine sediment metagenome]